MGCGPSRNESSSSSLVHVYQVEGPKKGTALLEPLRAKLPFFRTRPSLDSSEIIDVIQWDRIDTSVVPVTKIIQDSQGLEQEDFLEEDDPEIVSLHKNGITYLDEALRKSIESQTEPVNDEEGAFDWDLSDKADIETQTTPATRVSSTTVHATKSFGQTSVQDVIVQTDQRLTFLLHRSEEERIKRANLEGHASLAPGGVEGRDHHHGGKRSLVTYADASCQTFVEVQSIGIQVDPSELSGGSTRALQRPPTNFEEASDFSDADISTVHVQSKPGSQKSKRKLIRMRDGTYLGSPDDHSDPDEIILASEANIVSPSETPQPPTLSSDVGFQTNMTVAAVASSNSKNGRSSPVGYTGKTPHDLSHVPSNNNSAPVAGNGKKSAMIKRLHPKHKSDIGVQTDEELTEEAGGFKALPTATKKYELLGDNPEVFDPVDSWVIEISSKRYKSLKKIVGLLVHQIEEADCYQGIEDLAKIRAFYRWTTENIRYNEACMDREMSTRDILREKVGVCREYVKIFAEMCDIAGFRVKSIRGFTKGPNYKPGTFFGQGHDPPPHAWNAVYIYGGWRLVDCTWGAGRMNPETREFERLLNEHFFLPDPEELIYTHFPYDEAESNYSKWQLLDEPITLDTFNVMPLLNSMFFEYSLKLSKDIPQPLVTQEHIDIKIWAWEVVRYKYKFFARDHRESDELNQYVMCYLKGRQRKLGFFHVTPPEPGDYLLKIYAKPEEDIQSESDTLDHVATFHISAPLIKNKPMSLPRSDLPWGLTQAWFNTDARIVGINEPVIRMIGKKTHDLVIHTPGERLLSLCHIYDNEGNELVQDKDRDVKYTVLLNRRNPLPAGNEDEESSLLPFITKKETPKQTIFTIDNPPKEGFFKLQIYARKKPTKKGRLKIPLVANILVEFRHSNQVASKPTGVRRSFSSTSGGPLIPASSGLRRSELILRPDSLHSTRSSIHGGKSLDVKHTTISPVQEADNNTLSPVTIS